MHKDIYWAGMDVGSTTVKVAVVEPDSQKLIFSEYRRHNANQAGVVLQLLELIHEKFPEKEFKVAFCGSGGHPFAKETGAFFIQEVVANAVAIKNFYPETRVAIELGGQDAKVIFFRKDDATGQLVTSEMRMNGSCAGGTGAFVDQVAELLNVEVEEFGAYAQRGTIVYDISGRCGVFAKTDIQPLLNQGVSKEDIALSSFHAIAKQTIGGLAQGMTFTPPVIFEGGPLTFNPRLIEVFKERLGLEEDQAIVPENAEVLVAYGTAISIGSMFEDKESEYDKESALDKLRNYGSTRNLEALHSLDVFFQDEIEHQKFDQRHSHPKFQAQELKSGETLNAYLGIDAGSTTSKFVLLNEKEEVVEKFYANNSGDPLKLVTDALKEMRDKYRKAGVTLNLQGVGSTGYGELLFSKAFKTDYHTVETVAHAEAAKQIDENATFILDIGGQDMKAINLRGGVVTGITLNEACSAGCGSFIETYARSLEIPVQEIAGKAFSSDYPSRLGSRCTVFMNSSIITEQKHGKSPEDIMAGLCRSIIENVFTKVVRVPNLDALGDIIIVQGGTFKNEAVLRAFEQYVKKDVIRPPHPGEMGAIGIALLTKKHVESIKEKEGSYTTTFIGLDKLEEFTYETKPGLVCTFCSNNCNRTMVTFNDDSHFITGNRCERGEIVGDIKDPSVKEKLKAANQRISAIPNMMKRHSHLLLKDYQPPVLAEKRNIRIGIPRTFEFWVSLPFWKSLFTSLGFEVIISKKSDYKLFEEGLASISSDTICFPAKISHGHIKDLIRKKVDRIFMPVMISMTPENKSTPGSALCSVVQGYSMVIDKADEPLKNHGIAFDRPAFHWLTPKLKRKQIMTYLKDTFGINRKSSKKAFDAAETILVDYRDQLLKEGQEIIDSLEGSNDFAVVLAGRPYHSDELVNHDLASHFTSMGIPVLNLDSLPGIFDQDIHDVRMENINSFHARLLGAALVIARHPNLEMVQIVSFGCGHDAVLTDEVIRTMKMCSDKKLLTLKLDEGDVRGPLSIRVKSFIETIRSKREFNRQLPSFKRLEDPFPVKFTKEDRKNRTILIPNLSPSFSLLVARLFHREGLNAVLLPIADQKAIELGKKYVHNDICFPAQVNIGEALLHLKSGQSDPDKTAVCLAKNCENCRAGQYVTLARKALDEAGYEQVPLITSGQDTKNMHPGYSVNKK